MAAAYIQQFERERGLKRISKTAEKSIILDSSAVTYKI